MAFENRAKGVSQEGTPSLTRGHLHGHKKKRRRVIRAAERKSSVFGGEGKDFSRTRNLFSLKKRKRSRNRELPAAGRKGGRVKEKGGEPPTLKPLLRKDWSISSAHCVDGASEDTTKEKKGGKSVMIKNSRARKKRQTLRGMAKSSPRVSGENALCLEIKRCTPFFGRQVQ